MTNKIRFLIQIITIPLFESLGTGNEYIIEKKFWSLNISISRVEFLKWPNQRVDTLQYNFAHIFGNSYVMIFYFYFKKSRIKLFEMARKYFIFIQWNIWFIYILMNEHCIICIYKQYSKCISRILWIEYHTIQLMI